MNELKQERGNIMRIASKLFGILNLFLLSNIPLSVCRAEPQQPLATKALSSIVEEMEGYLDNIFEEFQVVFDDAQLSAKQQYSQPHSLLQYNRVKAMQEICDEADDAYTYRFNRISKELQDISFSQRQNEEWLYIQTGIRIHAIMAAAAAAIQYEQLHELHMRIIAERLRMHGQKSEKFKDILSQMPYTLLLQESSERIPFANAWDRLVLGMLSAAAFQVEVDYSSNEKAPVFLGIHVGDSAAAAAQEIPMEGHRGIVLLPIQLNNQQTAPKLALRELVIDVVSRDKASAEATRFVDLLHLQLKDPIVKHPYIEHFEAEAKAAGIYFKGEDFFKLDLADMAKIGFLRAKWENQGMLQLRLRVPPGQYHVYPEGNFEVLDRKKPNWIITDESFQEIAAYRFRLSDSGKRIDVEPIPFQTKIELSSLNPKFQILDFNLGRNNHTGDLEGSFGGRMFHTFGKYIALQTQGKFDFRNHRDWFDLDRHLETPPEGNVTLREQRELTDYSSREFQLDVGPVLRFGSMQFAVMQSLRFAKRESFDTTGMIGQLFFNAGFLFKQGQIGFFATAANFDEPVVKSVQFGQSLYEETYLKVSDQVGVNLQLNLFSNSYLEGSVGYIRSEQFESKAGGLLRYILPPFPGKWRKLRVTGEFAYNESFISPEDSWRMAFGIRWGDWGRSSLSGRESAPVPVFVPRVQYETITRVVRKGNQPPVADAGPDQRDVKPGTKVVLNGTKSYDPDGESIASYQWSQLAGEDVVLEDSESATPAFIAGNGQTYNFQLVVEDGQGAKSAPDLVVIQTLKVEQPQIIKFAAVPTEIQKGSSTTLAWETKGAVKIQITNIGDDLAPTGTRNIAPSETTTYTLVAFNEVDESVSASVTVTVKDSPVIVEFLANPPEISPGESSTLSWIITNATMVSLTNVGEVQLEGSITVQPANTTVYTLSAYNAAGEPATASVTVTVKNSPVIADFRAEPSVIRDGEESTLHWNVSNATSVFITNVGQVATQGSLTIKPQKDTVYTLNAYNAAGDLASATVTITVKHKLPVIAEFRAEPVYILEGSPTTLYWKVTDAARVYISNIGQVWPEGSAVVYPDQTTIYVLTALNESAEGPMASVTVLVQPAP